MRYLTDIQERTLRVVMKYSKGSAITGKEIAHAIDLPERESGLEGADMRAVVHALRKKGYPICASVDGYWYAKTSEELSTYIMELTARIASQTEVLEALKNSFDKVAIAEVPSDAVQPKYELQYDEEKGVMVQVRIN